MAPAFDRVFGNQDVADLVFLYVACNITLIRIARVCSLLKECSRRAIPRLLSPYPLLRTFFPDAGHAIRVIRQANCLLSGYPVFIYIQSFRLPHTASPALHRVLLIFVAQPSAELLFRWILHAGYVLAPGQPSEDDLLARLEDSSHRDVFTADPDPYPYSHAIRFRNSENMLIRLVVSRGSAMYGLLMQHSTLSMQAMSADNFFVLYAHSTFVTRSGFVTNGTMIGCATALNQLARHGLQAITPDSTTPFTCRALLPGLRTFGDSHCWVIDFTPQSHTSYWRTNTWSLCIQSRSTLATKPYTVFITARILRSVLLSLSYTASSLAAAYLSSIFNFLESSAVHDRPARREDGTIILNWDHELHAIMACLLGRRSYRIYVDSVLMSYPSYSSRAGW